MNDPLRRSNNTDELFPTSTLLNITRDVGASHLLYLTHDTWRGDTKLQCFDVSGNMLWEEAVKGKGSRRLSPVVSKLNGQLEPRIGKECLPVTQASSTQPQPSFRQPAATARDAERTPAVALDKPVALVSTPVVVLKKGTGVPLKFAQRVHSRITNQGDTVELVLADNLKVGDVLVVRKGARAIASVTQERGSGAMGKGGKLVLQVDFLKADRRALKLSGEGGGQRGHRFCWECGTVFGAVGIMAGVGKDYEIKEGTPVTAYVAEDVELPVLTQ